MKLKCLGSGSSGNCYLIENEKECLILDAGISIKEVKIALNFNIKKINGVVISHCHKDHSKEVENLRKMGIKVFTPYENFKKVVKFGNFTIRPFELQHDVPCYGFHINHQEMGNLLYISDTEYCKYRFKNINHMLIEANYSKELLCEASENSTKRNHVLTGHMELKTTLDFILTNDNNDLINIVLIHLSSVNSDYELFLQKTKEITDKSINIAEKGLEINLF